MKKAALLSTTLLAVALAANNVLAKDDPIKKAQELRQAPMKLIGNNFGFMRAMAEGKIPWDADAFAARGKELGAIGQLDLMRGYIEDSYEGKTRTKPDVELEFDDFTEKMRKFEKALQAFGTKANADAMKAGLEDLGKNCKSCHKKYKSKEYQAN
jgi:cytochrome c556